MQDIANSNLSIQLTTNKNILCIPISGFEIDITADFELKI